MSLKYSNLKSTSFNFNLAILQRSLGNLAGFNWVLVHPRAALIFFLFRQTRKTLNLLWKKNEKSREIKIALFYIGYGGPKLATQLLLCNVIDLSKQCVNTERRGSGIWLHNNWIMYLLCLVKLTDYNLPMMMITDTNKYSSYSACNCKLMHNLSILHYKEWMTYHLLLNLSNIWIK